MSTTDDTIKVFKVDDWAYVAALSPEEAGIFVENDSGRPEDPSEREIELVNPTGNLAELLKNYIDSNGSFPAQIGVDGHYA